MAMVAGRLADRLGGRPLILVGLALTAAATLAYTQVGSFGIAILAVVLQHQTAGASTPAALAAAFGRTFWRALAFIAIALVPTLLLGRLRPAAGVAQAHPAAR